MQQQQEQQQQQQLQQQLQLQQQQQNLFLQAQQLSAQPTGFGSVIPVISGYQLTNSAGQTTHSRHLNRLERHRPSIHPLSLFRSNSHNLIFKELTTLTLHLTYRH